MPECPIQHFLIRCIIYFLNARKKIFPSGRSCFCKIILDKNGIMVKATNKEATMVNKTAIGSGRMNSPEPSGKKTSGKKANNKATVQPMTAVAICLVATIAASFRLYPCRINRSMFSTITIESSTSKPNAMTSPNTQLIGVYPCN